MLGEMSDARWTGTTLPLCAGTREVVDAREVATGDGAPVNKVPAGGHTRVRPRLAGSTATPRTARVPAEAELRGFPHQADLAYSVGRFPSCA